MPDVSLTTMRLSPGFCDASQGAVERNDWRDASRYANPNSNDGAVSLRRARTSAIVARLAGSWQARLSSNTAWYVKQVWREGFKNESTYVSAAAADGVSDTADGFYNSRGRLEDRGEFWRHRRVCHGAPCAANFLLHRRAPHSLCWPPPREGRGRRRAARTPRPSPPLAHLSLSIP